MDATDVVPATSTAIAVVEPSRALATLATMPTTTRALVMVEALKEDTEQRAILAQYIRHHMLEGVDYGVLPGGDKNDKKRPKCLFKPGAEKLIDLYRCTARFTVVRRVENWETSLFHYEFRCRITSRDTQAMLAEGYGSCNSREAKYRWREDQRLCPQCKVPAILQSKARPAGNGRDAQKAEFFCWRKKGGCGATFAINDKAITEQKLGRCENDDIASTVNTILKMAKKRAQVDAAIILARCSDMFTQDIEDQTLPDEHGGGEDESRGTAATGGGSGTRTQRQVQQCPLLVDGKRCLELDGHADLGVPCRGPKAKAADKAKPKAEGAPAAAGAARELSKEESAKFGPEKGSPDHEFAEILLALERASSLERVNEAMARGKKLPADLQKKLKPSCVVALKRFKDYDKKTKPAEVVAEREPGQDDA